MRTRCARFVPLVAATIGLTSAARAVVPEYTILDLGTLGGVQSQAWGLNSAGQVVGQSKTADGSVRAFLTSPNSAINPITDALPLVSGGTTNVAYSVNDAGQVAGVAATASGDRAYRCSGGTASDLGTLGGDWSYAYAINGVGHVVGGAALPTPPFSLLYPTHAFINDGTMHDLGTLGGVAAGGNQSYANAINSSGRIVGYSEVAQYSPSHAFLWTPATTNGTTGSMIDLGSLGGSSSYAWGINDDGVIVGGANTTGDLAYHAFLRTAGATPTMVDLNTLGGASSEAYAVNGLSMVVGYSDTPASTTHAFLYADGAMHDLNDLIPAGSGWTLSQGRAINDRAQIVGWGINSSGETHGYLLTPLPTWNTDADGNWSSATNWLGVVPSGAGTDVRFTGAITAPRTVTLDSPRTVGRIVFDNLNSYMLAGPGTLTLDGSDGAAGIEVRAGSHVVAAALQAKVPATIKLADATGLQLAGHLDGAFAGLDLASSSVLDLVRNTLVIDYDPAGGSPLQTIRAKIASARNGGSWDGAGITSSIAAADASHTTALGCGEASSIGVNSVSGVVLDGSDVIVKYTYAGDANLDGEVDVSDLGALATHWQQSSDWTGGDFNYDGMVDVSDLGDLATNWQRGVGNPLAAQTVEQALAAVGLSAAATVPEPVSTAILGAVIGCVLLGRNRGHRSHAPMSGSSLCVWEPEK